MNECNQHLIYGSGRQWGQCGPTQLCFWAPFVEITASIISGETATKTRPNPPPPISSSVPHAQVIHHDGHLDYLVNGRLIHPVQVDSAAAGGNNGDGAETGGATTTHFEDHGSIRALDDDFVTFWSSFSLLSETADEEVLSFCDMCSSDEAGGGVNLSPVPL